VHTYGTAQRAQDASRLTNLRESAQVRAQLELDRPEHAVNVEHVVGLFAEVQTLRMGAGGDG